jgi:hypothetical protein
MPCAEIDRAAASLLRSAPPLLSLAASDAAALKESSSSTAALAEALSSRVRHLDAAHSRADAALARAEAALDRSRALEAARQALAVDDLAAAATTAGRAFPVTRDPGRERPLKIRAAPTPMVSPPSPPSQYRAGSGVPRSGGLLLLHPAAWAPMLKIRRGRCLLKNRRCLQMRPAAATQDAAGGGSRSGRRRRLKMRPADSFSRVRPPPPPPW